MHCVLLSREARLKIAKHAWNVVPLEAFGFLLGDAETQQVLVALPCSKTSAWGKFDDRWNGIVESIPLAEKTANEYGLSVAGFYGSADFDFTPGIDI
ncbi:MAG: hypothetical protein WC340_00970 [Kiritimatiellia bacterium]|jgi:proteasome lid subunit RPN8/RPN11